RGSTGTVYLCSHVTLDKHVALKVLHPELSGNPGMVARFQREAQAAARLDHAHSVRVIDVQASGELLYLAMEYVEGRDLAQILMEDWPLSDERVITIMSQILSALAAAHALGIVHRDLKPENILLRAPKTDEEGRTSGDDVVVCDFGLAQLSPVRLAGPAIAQPRMHAVTAQGRVVGTPAYMSPEQARAESQDARSDIYSAGVLLFQLLTRTLPFVADAPLAVAAMHCVTPPPPPSGYRPVNAALEAICLKALSKTREARYQTAREMQLALDAALPKRPAAKSGKRLSVPPSFTRTSSPAVPLEHDSELLASSPTIIRRSRNHSLAPAELVVQPERAPRRRLSSQQRIGVAVALLALVSVPSLLTRAKQPRHLPPRAATAQPQVSPASLPLMAAEPIAPIAIAAPPKPAPAEAPSDIAATKIVDELDVAKREPRIVVKPEPIVQAKRTVRRAIDKPHTQVEVSAIEPQPLAADPNFNAMLASMQTVQTTAPSEEAQAAPRVPVETAQTAPAEEPIAALPAPIVLSN
ncbi:MAG TPA: protein kinase, partial [Polyangiales bacterium]